MGIRTGFLTLAMLAGLLGMYGTAGAVGDGEELWRTPGTGSGANELGFPFAVASDPVTGHVYTAEFHNNRVSEFTPWGAFVKAFGWDVAPGAVNEQQEVRVKGTGGEFRLSFGADTTTDLPFDAGGVKVEAALNSLGSVSTAGGSVIVKAVEGTAGTTPYVYVVTFRGSLSGSDTAPLVATKGTTPLVGDVLVRTRAHGGAGGEGLESCTEESGCKAGLTGSESGQLADVRGIAVDPEGAVYLREVGNRRVQKFDPSGRFLLMFGGEVNKTSGANLCTQSSGDACGIGIASTDAGAFGDSNSPGIVFADKVFVGDIERIQRFDSDGTWELSVPVIGKTVHHLAVAPGTLDFYATIGSTNGTEQGVRILDGDSGLEVGSLVGRELTNSKGEIIEATKATGGPVAVDSAGNVFVRRNNLSMGEGEPPALPLLQFDASGEQTSEFGLGLQGAISALGTNLVGDLHVALGDAGEIVAYGPGPVELEGPPKRPPEITGQYASSVQGDSATVAADINPRFFDNTTYYVEYGAGPCKEGGCTLEKPLPPGGRLTTKTSNVPLRAAGINLEGLVPGTTYYYRFVAESTGGGPVFGIDPDGEGPEEATQEEGLEATFIAPDLIRPRACSNDSFRGGGGARLPNCRAYEMVSPVDKNNGDIKTLVNIQGFSTSFLQGAGDGGRFTYSSYRAFADPAGAPFTNQLLATRTPGGWISDAIDAPQGPAANTNLNILGNNFKDFTDDLCVGWLVVAAEPQLDPPRDVPDYPNVYRRDNCGGARGSYEALVPVHPTVSQNVFYPEPQGASANGSASIFRINDKLTDDAIEGPWQTYYASEGNLELICFLPNGIPSGGNCSGGSGGDYHAGLDQPHLGRFASVTNAISANGNRVYWTDSAAQETGAGKVYLRVNPGEEQSAVSGTTCTEPAKACTLKVSEPSTTRDSRFLVATPDGSKALFEITEGPAEGDLYEFNLGGPARLIAGETLGIAGTSEDLSRIYFVSREALADGATAGEPNLYLEDDEELEFVATLSDEDAIFAFGAEATPTDTARKPIYHAAQASKDGTSLAFISTADLTDYDNTDQANGEADSEVYLYKAGADGPVCVSCNPSRARPEGRIVRLNRDAGTLSVAATLQLPTSMLHFPRVISADGSRVFFNSFDPLLPRDTNNAADVYMWESAGDKAACANLGAELYVSAASGCVSLISSGQSPEDSEFVDASLNGDDAFFITNSSLLPQDPGLFDVYDARANGGLPGPVVPAPDCQGETCKPPATAPNDPTPASSTYVGPGDLKEKKAKKKSKKSKKKKKKAKNKKKNAKNKQGAKVRAGK